MLTYRFFCWRVYKCTLSEVKNSWVIDFYIIKGSMQMEEVLYAYDSSSIQFAYAHLRFG